MLYCCYCSFLFVLLLMISLPVRRRMSLELKLRSRSISPLQLCWESQLLELPTLLGSSDCRLLLQLLPRCISWLKQQISSAPHHISWLQYCYIVLTFTLLPSSLCLGSTITSSNSYPVNFTQSFPFSPSQSDSFYMPCGNHSSILRLHNLIEVYEVNHLAIIPLNRSYHTHASFHCRGGSGPYECGPKLQDFVDAGFNLTGAIYFNSTGDKCTFSSSLECLAFIPTFDHTRVVEVLYLHNPRLYIQYYIDGLYYNSEAGISYQHNDCMQYRFDAPNNTPYKYIFRYNSTMYLGTHNDYLNFVHYAAIYQQNGSWIIDQHYMGIKFETHIQEWIVSPPFPNMNISMFSVHPLVNTSSIVPGSLGHKTNDRYQATIYSEFTLDQPKHARLCVNVKLISYRPGVNLHTGKPGMILLFKEDCLLTCVVNHETFKVSTLNKTAFLEDTSQTRIFTCQVIRNITSLKYRLRRDFIVDDIFAFDSIPDHGTFTIKISNSIIIIT